MFHAVLMWVHWCLYVPFVQALFKEMVSSDLLGAGNWVFHRVFFVRCSQLNNRVMKLSHELKEEQEMNRCLRANQVQLQSQLAEEERKGKEKGKKINRNIHLNV